MRLIKGVVLVIMGLVFSCQDQERTEIQTGSEIIVDSFSDIPFDIQRPPAIVPDSLGGQHLAGKMLLKVMIDSSGSIVSYKILALLARDSNGANDIEYRMSESKDDRRQIAPFVNWTEDYLSKVVVTRKSDYDKRYEMEKYTILMPVKFGE